MKNLGRRITLHWLEAKGKRPERDGAWALVCQTIRVRLASYPRPGLNSASRCGRVHGLPVVCFRESSWSRRLQATRWHCQILAFADECQPILIAIPVDANQIAKMYLFRSQQIRQWIHDVALDGPFQMARAISLIRTFLKQKFFAGPRYPKQELTLGRFQNSLLHLSQFDIQNFLQLLSFKWMKANYFVQPVHEFR